MSKSLRAVATMADLVDALGRVPSSGRAVILIGGADFTEADRMTTLRRFFANLATHLERTGTALVDGGTDSGVMRLIAEARTSIGGTFPLIGVAPGGALEGKTRAGAPIAVALDHTLVLKVPGSRFGEETSWLFAAADHLAGGSAATIVVNGGHLTFDEAHQRIDAGHRVVAISGSGRAADDLAADEGLRASGRLRVIPLTVDDAGLAGAIDGSWMERGIER